ncbi:hypothetical protein [Kosakonia arachidis]|uniref:hypothetical protein n=1 Tax=Kosakonia arachidis TaxID=551989 RepID=UPI00142F1FE3|nr:hypothetical protein [Kosakonia arachidis]
MYGLGQQTGNGTHLSPAPAFTHISRLARSAASLATVKMQNSLMMRWGKHETD